jgi:hypothetical protein
MFYILDWPQDYFTLFMDNYYSIDIQNHHDYYFINTHDVEYIYKLFEIYKIISYNININDYDYIKSKILELKELDLKVSIDAYYKLIEPKLPMTLEDYKKTSGNLNIDDRVDDFLKGYEKQYKSR